MKGVCEDVCNVCDMVTAQHTCERHRTVVTVSMHLVTGRQH